LLPEKRSLEAGKMGKLWNTNGALSKEDMNSVMINRIFSLNSPAIFT